MGTNDADLTEWVDPIDFQLTKIEVQLSKPVWGVRDLGSDFTQGMVREAVARLNHRFHYQLSVAKRRRDRGALESRQGDWILGPRIGLKHARYGESVNMESAARLSLDGGWGRIAPQIQRAIDLEPREVYSRFVNYGHLVTDWTKSFFFDTARVANPKRLALGTYPNMLTAQGAVPLPDRVREMHRYSIGVKGIDGIPYGLESARKFLWLPTAKFDEGYLGMSVLNIVPANNGVASGGGNTSKIFGLAEPVHVPWLRSDMMVLASVVPDEEMLPFVKIRGFRQGEGMLEENPDVENVGAGIPEFEVIIQDKTSHLYATEGLVSWQKRHYRGYGPGWGGGLVASYDGLPTDADPEAPTIDYTTLPKRFY